METGRITWLNHLVEQQQELAKEFLSGKGIGPILKDVSMKFKAPVTFPDSILVATKLEKIQQVDGERERGHTVEGDESVCWMLIIFIVMPCFSGSFHSLSSSAQLLLTCIQLSTKNCSRRTRNNCML